MVPAMEDRTGHHQPQGTEVPVEVGVQQESVKGEKGEVAGQDQRGKAHEEKGQGLQEFAEDVVDGMETHRREPVDLGGTVVDGVKLPQPGPVKQAMAPVAY